MSDRTLEDMKKVYDEQLLGLREMERSCNQALIHIMEIERTQEERRKLLADLTEDLLKIVAQ